MLGKILGREWVVGAGDRPGGFMLVSPKRVSLNDLPPPPPGKRGWPWTTRVKPLPERMSDGSPWPRLSIVTPSYNQGQFLEATIRSVLLQGYPNLEYIVMDGGSTDASVRILEKYSIFLDYWVSEPDEGQADAINKGLRQTTGDLNGWINSDDVYVRDSFYKVVTAFQANPESIVVHGNRILIDDQDRVFGCAPLPPFHHQKTNFIVCSETAFWRKAAMERCGFLDKDLKFAMDLEFFCRLYLQGSFTKLNDYLGYFRCHSSSKSSTIWDVAEDESARVWRRLFEEDWPRFGFRASRLRVLWEFMKHPGLLGWPYCQTRFGGVLGRYA